MTVSNRTRDDAATICAIAASTGDASPISYAEIAMALGLCGPLGSCPASRLAYSASGHVIWMSIALQSTGAEILVDAEAEALLREGWGE